MDSTMLAGLLGVIGGVVGVLIGGWFTLRAATHQIETMTRQLRGDVHERLYNQNQQLIECLATYPKLRPFFCENQPLEKCDNQEERNRVLLIAEMYVGFYELIAIQLPDLPDYITQEWTNFIIQSYQSSPAIREYLKEYEGWYSQKLHEVLQKSVTDYAMKEIPKST